MRGCYVPPDSIGNNNEQMGRESDSGLPRNRRGYGNPGIGLFENQPRRQLFLLESVEGGQRLARYSFIGTEPYRELTTDAKDHAEPVGPDCRRTESI